MYRKEISEIKQIDITLISEHETTFETVLLVRGTK